MDPDANLREQREIARQIQTGHWSADDVERLAELVVALDEWIKKGGYLPNDWPKDRRPRRV